MAPMMANVEATAILTEAPIERVRLEAGGGGGGVVVGRVGVVADTEAAVAEEETDDCELVGADVAELPVEELAVEVADHVATEGPGVLIYLKESVFPAVALTKVKWQPVGLVPPTEERT
ncbi:MAG: hypothetical protein M1840_006704 [Geoglossum simile]|nr:MAG: hypothetical protein M1840_006704 [Geoglossum simile]